MAYFSISFVLGLIFVAPYLAWVHRLSLRDANKALGFGLFIAAVIYIGFAWFNGNGNWLVVELIGVAVYGLAVWLALRYSILWLAAGWVFHPVWDVCVHWLGPGTHIVPAWYAIACLSFDLAVAIFIVVKWQGARVMKTAG
ncbi:MAG: hypothetical protein MI746_01670 [Pseudomonadales bacterium]|nr:hypothetical protein [Pseudomonadales bacterium]